MNIAPVGYDGECIPAGTFFILSPYSLSPDSLSPDSPSVWPQFLIDRLLFLYSFCTVLHLLYKQHLLSPNAPLFLSRLDPVNSLRSSLTFYISALTPRRALCLGLCHARRLSAAELEKMCSSRRVSQVLVYRQLSHDSSRAQGTGAL